MYDIPVRWPGGILGNTFDDFPPGSDTKTALPWNLRMTWDAELVTGVPGWHNFLLGITLLGLFFTGVEASGALSWDVLWKLLTSWKLTQIWYWLFPCNPPKVSKKWSLTRSCAHLQFHPSNNSFTTTQICRNPIMHLTLGHNQYFRPRRCGKISRQTPCLKG